MFRAGEIVIAAFPFSSLAGIKRRPGLVLARGDSPDDFIIAFITSNLNTRRLPSAVPVEPSHPNWKQTGLKAASVIRCDKLVTLNDSVISGAIGILPSDRMAIVQSNLKMLFSIT